MYKSVRYLICTLVIPCMLYAAPSCVSKSYHLTRPNDPKEYHYVENCNCPCDKQYHIYANGRCSQCMHLQDPRRSARHINIVRAPAPTIDVRRLRAAATQNVKRCHSLL
jgi:hypothetical protein